MKWQIKKFHPGVLLLCNEAGDPLRELPEALARKLGVGIIGDHDLPDLPEQIERQEPK